MRIVVDTNVLISGIFFGGAPQRILHSIVTSKITACATAEIIDEYIEIVEEMIERKQGHLNKDILSPLPGALQMIEPPKEPVSQHPYGTAERKRSEYLLKQWLSHREYLKNLEDSVAW